jgi:hypothetical protein
MRRRGVSTRLWLIWLLWPGALVADFRIEGGADRDFPGTAGVVAVLPAICPENVDCAWLDRRVAGEILRRQRPEFRSAAATQAALTRLGASQLTAENRAPLASSLGAQTLLEIRVRELEKERTKGGRDPDERPLAPGEKYDREGGSDGGVRGRLEIRAISAETGRTVAEGAAEGDAPGLSEKKLLGPMLTRLIDRMFPLPRR